MKEKHPELYMPQTNIDRRQTTRMVSMQVMNLGFPRTGTMCKSVGSLRSCPHACILILHQDLYLKSPPQPNDTN